MRRFRTCFLFGVWVLAALLSRPASAQTAGLDRAAALAEEALAEDGRGGLSFGIVDGANLVYAAGIGYADRERGIEATAEHVYRIGSITKQLTALALVQMSEAGTLRLTDPVERLLPEIRSVPGLPEGTPPPTLLQLATMTSGLAREPEHLPTYLVGPASQWADVTLRALGELRYDFPPDTRYQYSNIGYAILGVALERASGEPYMDYVRASILEPLSMSDTDFVPLARFENRIATGYDIEDGVVDYETPAWEHLGRGYKVPNGALYSTVADLARFVSFELGNGPESVLSKERLGELFSRLSSAEADLGAGYGLGLSATRRGELVFLGHGGSVAGYRAAAYFHRDSQSGVVVLRNVTGDSLDVTELAFRMLEEVVREKNAPR